MAEVEYVNKDQFDGYKKLMDDRFDLLQSEVRRLRGNGRVYPNSIMSVPTRVLLTVLFGLATVSAIALNVVVIAQ